MKLVTIVATTAAILVPAYASFAQDRTQDQTQSQTRQTIRDRDIYGYQLMTPQERSEYRQRMRAAKTVQEREQVRAEHHEEMQKRAEARGITLPDTPPAARGGGMGPGRGMGPGGGMGSGNGMGPGGGMGPGNGMGPGGGMGRGR